MNFRLFWQAPFRTLYSLSFYRSVLKQSLHAGIVWLAILSVFAAVLAGISLRIRSFPETREFVEWLKTSAPKMVMTGSGLQMDEQSPYRMIHPRYGPLITIDLSGKEPVDHDFENGTMLFLTSRKAFLRVRGNARTFDYLPRNKDFLPYPITGEVYEKYGETLRLLLVTGVPVFVFFFFFMWKFLAALIYSGFAGVINRFRQEPLPYGKVLNLCLFAMTPFIWIEFMTLFIPGFEIRGGFFTGLAVTLLYLAIVLLKTEQPLVSAEY